MLCYNNSPEVLIAEGLDANLEGTELKDDDKKEVFCQYHSCEFKIT